MHPWERSQGTIPEDDTYHVGTEVMDKPDHADSGKDLRVLHVDDEPLICDVTRLCLEKGGRFRVDAVHTPEEALSLLRAAPYACVISDYEMPTMNGIELLREIRSFDQEIPFILFSGRGRETVIIDAINTGADFYIQKGGDTKSLFAELNHKVDYAIGKRNARVSLKRRDAILQAVSLGATLFLGGDSFHAAAGESAALFGLATEVDRVMIFRLEEGGGEIPAFTRLCQWIRPGISEDNRSFLPDLSGFSSLVEKILQGESIIGTVDSFDPVIQDLMLDHHIRSVAVFPVIARQKVRGMIWFCDCLSEREWPPVETEALRAAAAIIGSALNQEEMRSELVAGKERYESLYSMMRRLCDTVPDLLWATDPENRFTFVNHEAARVLLGETDTSRPIGRSERDCGFSGDSVTGEAGSWDERFERTLVCDGETLDLEIRKTPFSDPSGHRIGTVAVGRDVTDRRRIERIIRAEQRKYSRVFHSVHIGLITCLPDGEITGINQRVKDIIGADPAFCKGSSLFSVRGLVSSGLFSDFSFSLADRSEKKGKGEYLDPAGISHILYYRITPLHDDSGEVIDLLISLDEHYLDG